MKAQQFFTIYAHTVLCCLLFIMLLFLSILIQIFVFLEPQIDFNLQWYQPLFLLEVFSFWLYANHDYFLKFLIRPHICPESFLLDNDQYLWVSIKSCQSVLLSYAERLYLDFDHSDGLVPSATKFLVQSIYCFFEIILIYDIPSS